MSTEKQKTASLMIHILGQVLIKEANREDYKNI